jgi:hypothetical protein
MSEWLPWVRMSISTPLTVEELQKRLATVTAEWAGDWRGHPVPMPPWERESFVARCPGGWSNLPLVVAGTVRARNGGAVLGAVVRPPYDVIVGAAVWIAVFAAAVASASLPAVLAAALAGCIPYAVLMLKFFTKSQAVEEVLRQACNVGDDARVRPS